VTELAASDLTVRRGVRTILDQVSLQAQGGEFLAVVGANGAGKSTLLSVLAGLTLPDRGRIALDGTPLASLSRTALARRRSYLPQNPRCDWPIPVERLVALGLIPHLPAFGDLPAGLRPQLESVLASCDLLPLRMQAATTLSGGELARAMLARALVANPDIVVVDEPTAGLDPRHALDAVTRLQALARDGKLVIAALHDLTLAARYATRVIALKNGRVIGDGPISETLTPELLEALFDVSARVARTPAGAFVDYGSPDAVAPATRPN
jgi:iron complex transport system ATP-binding protein